MRRRGGGGERRGGNENDRGDGRQPWDRVKEAYGVNDVSYAALISRIGGGHSPSESEAIGGLLNPGRGAGTLSVNSAAQVIGAGLFADLPIEVLEPVQAGRVRADRAAAAAGDLVMSSLQIGTEQMLLGGFLPLDVLGSECFYGYGTGSVITQNTITSARIHNNAAGARTALWGFSPGVAAPDPYRAVFGRAGPGVWVGHPVQTGTTIAAGGTSGVLEFRPLRPCGIGYMFLTSTGPLRELSIISASIGTKNLLNAGVLPGSECDPTRPNAQSWLFPIIGPSVRLRVEIANNGAAPATVWTSLMVRS